MTSLANRYNDYDNEIKPANCPATKSFKTSASNSVKPVRESRLFIEKNVTVASRANNSIGNTKNSPKSVKNNISGSQQKENILLDNKIIDTLQAQGFNRTGTDGKVVLEYKKPVVIKYRKTNDIDLDDIDPALLPVNQRRLIFEQKLNKQENVTTHVKNKFSPNVVRGDRNQTKLLDHRSPVKDTMVIVKDDMKCEKNKPVKSTDSTPRKRKSQPDDDDGGTLSSRARLVDVLYKDSALHSVGTSNSSSDNDERVEEFCAGNNDFEENMVVSDNRFNNNHGSMSSDDGMNESLDLNMPSVDTRRKTSESGSFENLLSLCQRESSNEFTTLIQNSENIFRKLLESDTINSVDSSEINGNTAEPFPTMSQEHDDVKENGEDVSNSSPSALNMYRDCLEKVRSLADANAGSLSKASSRSSLSYSCEEVDENENERSARYSINDEDLLSEHEKVELKKAELDKVIDKEKMVRRQAFLGIESCNEKINFNDQRTFEAFKEMKKLLIISERVLAVSQEELDRLNVEKTYRPSHELNTQIESIMGDITISNIRLYINLETVSSDSLAGMENNLFCAIRHEQSILSTEIIPVNKSSIKNMNSSSYIEFTKKFRFSKMPCSFKIFIEIYNLFDNTSVGNTPVKMNANKSVGSKDKKKKEACKLRSQTRFLLVGFVVFSVDELRRTHLTITKKHEVHSPVVGEMDLSLSSFGVMKDNKGFLTMREVIMQWHNWTRLWFVARGSFLYYWKYPEDEFEKDPIGVIDMRNCTTKEVGPVGVDVARRPHTFQLHFKNIEPDVTEGDALHNIILSADDEENEIMWHKHLNLMLKSCNIWADIRPIDSI